MKVGIVHDYHPQERIGGAQYQLEDLVAAAPEGVEPIWCIRGQAQEADAYIIAGITSLRESQIAAIGQLNKPKVRLVMDYDNWRPQWVMDYLATCKAWFFRSPMHAEYYPYKSAVKGSCVLPVPIDLQAIAQTPEAVDRAGVMWCGSWEPRKGGDIVAEWALRSDIHVDLYGPGMEAKEGRWVTWHGCLPNRLSVYAEMKRHKTFVAMPRYPSTFGVEVLEAIACGCEIVTAGRIGAMSYMMPVADLLEHCQHSPEAFWQRTLEAVA